jgi:hypothetical protein
MGQQLRERGAARLLVVGEDHLAHGADAVLLEEHVLGAAEPDALGAELERDAGVVRGIGIGAHTELAHRVGPAHQRAELAGQRRLRHRHAAREHLPGRAVDGDDIARLERAPGNAHGAGGVVYAQLCFLLRLDLLHSGAAPSISALYHLDELRISFGAVKLLPIITLPGYRCRPFQRIGPT